MGSVAVLPHEKSNMDTMVTEPFFPSDELLATRVQQGDHHAFTTLVNRHGNRYFGLAYRLLNDSQEAKDMVQNAFLKFWKNPFYWDAKRQSRFTTWFYRVVLNQCLDFKKKKREQHPEQCPEPMLLPDSDANLDRERKHLWVRNQIQKLPQNQQIALQLCFFQGMTNEDAAQTMGIRLKALQSLLVRAKQKLKNAKAQEFQEPSS